MIERELTRAPLTAAELKALGKRLGGVRELVGPKRRAETADLNDAQLVEHLVANPGHVRRPLIDTGKVLTAGFKADAREALGG